MRRTIFSFCVISMLSSLSIAQDRLSVFDKITLLVSTKSDFEKIFGKPVKPYRNIYENDEFKVTARYSFGRCGEPSQLGVYDVPKDTLWKLIISPQKPLSVDEIWARYREQFTRGKDPNFADVFYYSNEDSSVVIQTKLVAGFEDVVVITYAPRNDSARLRCTKPNSK